MFIRRKRFTELTNEVVRLREGAADTQHNIDEIIADLCLLRDSQVGALAGAPATPFVPEKHPFVTMEKGVTIAPGVRIMAPNADHAVHLGEYVKIYRGNEILGPVTIGDYSFINRDGYIRAKVTIGSRVAIGAFCRLVTDNHELGSSSQRAGKFFTEPITICDGVFIGANVTVVGGVTIGGGSIVGAGAVVVKDVPPNSVVGGVPARLIRQLDS